MRRRIGVLVLAVTALVVVAYTVPLAILVRSQADERARGSAERTVQAVASSVVTLVSPTGEIDMASIRESVVPAEGVGILSSDGSVLGVADFDRDFAAWTANARVSSSFYREDGSWQISLPVIARDGWVVVSAVVPESELTRGVVRAWVFLTALGLTLIATALLMADRLGRTMRDPVDDLAAAARRIGSGDLDTRVEAPDIPELHAIADALNRLAPQLRNLLDSEREALADLSHRLRTPLAALRLQSEALADAGERSEVLALVDRLQGAVDRIIIDARRVDPDVRSDLAAVARQHAAFWSVLADEEHRSFTTVIPADPIPLSVSAEELGDVIDILIGNVFDHTERGCGFDLRVEVIDGTAILSITDEGTGFPAGIDPLARGESTKGTGLGLDIARRMAERLAGSIALENRTGGASVTLRLPISG